MLQLVELADLGVDDNEHCSLFINYNIVLNNLHLCKGGDVPLHAPGHESMSVTGGSHPENVSKCIKIRLSYSGLFHVVGVQLLDT